MPTEKYQKKCHSNSTVSTMLFLELFFCYTNLCQDVALCFYGLDSSETNSAQNRRHLHVHSVWMHHAGMSLMMHMMRMGDNSRRKSYRCWTWHSHTHMRRHVRITSPIIHRLTLGRSTSLTRHTVHRGIVCTYNYIERTQH